MSLALCRPVDQVRGGPGIAALEPKFDGWRCQVRAGAGRLWSRHGTDLSAAFADIAQASRALPDCVLDGELVAVLDSGELAFGKLQSRSGRGPRSHEGFTVHLAAFDVLAVGDTDWRPKPYAERRGRLLLLAMSRAAEDSTLDELSAAVAWSRTALNMGVNSQLPWGFCGAGNASALIGKGC
ncbi:ATP-dependent DNA ligase [Streptomyces mirabilis]|uniref:ATP-dependent DNA ligase n=1 Tax=Streptomyces mirabilis TaxID=68239 RepID=UPI0036987971